MLDWQQVLQRRRGTSLRDGHNFTASKLKSSSLFSLLYWTGTRLFLKVTGYTKLPSKSHKGDERMGAGSHWSHRKVVV